jgi:hypothetical protein
MKNVYKQQRPNLKWLWKDELEYGIPAGLLKPDKRSA